MIADRGQRSVSDTDVSIQIELSGAGGVRRTSRNRWPFIGALGMLLHMLGQVCLLCVGLTTVLADVGFEMFRFLVLWNVLQQVAFIAETFVA